MSLSELILNLKAAVKGSKDNSNMVLRDSSGFWKPAHKTLEATVKELERTEKLIAEIDQILTNNFGSQSPVVSALKYAREMYDAAEEQPLNALAEAKKKMIPKDKK